MRKIKKTILLFLAIVTIFSLGIVNHKKEIIELMPKRKTKEC